MKTKRIFIVLLLVVFQTTNGQEKIKATDRNKEYIEFLKEFYTEYLIKTNLDNQKNKIYQNFITILNKYCTSSLVEKILNAEIDYDPFIYAQDFHISILNYLKVEKYGDNLGYYEVSFRYTNEDDSQRTRIRLEVINTTEGCKISNIISNYDVEKGLTFPLDWSEKESD